MKYHSVQILDKGLSKGELTSVVNAVGIENLADEKSKEYLLFKHLTNEGKFDKLLECPALLNTPIVRNGKQATVGNRPEIWKTWD